MITRAQAGVMSDLMLDVTIDGCTHRLRECWNSGRPGKLIDIYSLAICAGEFAIREAERRQQQVEMISEVGGAATVPGPDPFQ